MTGSPFHSRMATPVYRQLHVQVLVAIAAGFLLGHFSPDAGSAMKPLGDGFIKLIKMVVAPIIFCTVVVGIAGMRDVKQVGRTGGMALLNFELVTTLALIVGMVVANILQLGAGMHVDPRNMDRHALPDIAARTRSESFDGFLLNIIPDSVVDAFAKGDILQVLLFSVLFGFALNRCADQGDRVFVFIEQSERALFAVVNMILKLAPIGTFGAVAFTIGKFGIVAMIPLGGMLLAFYLACAGFVVLGLGIIARLHRFSLWRLFRYFHEEFMIVLGTSSSDAVLPSVVAKMERIGVPKASAALVVPTGFSFNMVGTSIYLGLSVVFIAQATDTPMGFWTQLMLLGVLMLTSKGARGITGSGFIVLAATLSAVDLVPLGGLAILLGIDRFMSVGRALTNLAGNVVATIVIARWTGDLDAMQLTNGLVPHDDKGCGQPVS